MKLPAFLAISIFLGGCATVTPYAGPRTSESTEVIVSATGLEKHAMFQDDVLFIHILEENGGLSRGTIRLSPDHSQQAISVDRGAALVLRYMSTQPHFGGYSYCNRDVPFVATDALEHRVIYSTQKDSCTIQISKINEAGDTVVLSDVKGVAGGLQYEAEVIR